MGVLGRGLVARVLGVRAPGAAGQGRDRDHEQVHRRDRVVGVEVPSDLDVVVKIAGRVFLGVDPEAEPQPELRKDGPQISLDGRIAAHVGREPWVQVRVVVHAQPSDGLVRDRDRRRNVLAEVLDEPLRALHGQPDLLHSLPEVLGERRALRKRRRADGEDAGIAPHHRGGAIPHRVFIHSLLLSIRRLADDDLP